MQTATSKRAEKPCHRDALKLLCEHKIAAEEIISVEPDCIAFTIRVDGKRCLKSVFLEAEYDEDEEKVVRVALSETYDGLPAERPV